MQPSMSSLQIDRAASFLASRQDADGYWRDYRLEPGQSEAWTTACVGFALFQAAGSCREVDKAARILQSTRRPGGWGYNSHTSCDADTTSWVIRFLSAAGALERIDSARLLSAYVTDSGQVMTFPSPDRFGSWGQEHDEVAPVAGMALFSSGEFGLAEKLRQAVLKRASWKPFWWRCYSYVCAQSLEFLSLSGGIPDEIKRRETEALTCLSPSPSSAFDLAQRLAATYFLDGDLHRDGLLDAQEKDGGWRPSPELLVPCQKDGNSGKPNPDERRLMTTAMSIIALLKREKEAPPRARLEANGEPQPSQ